MNSLRPKLSESNTPASEVSLSPEFKFVTDLAQTLLLAYGKDLEGNDGGAQLQWYHPSGDFALNLTTSIKWNDTSDVVGGQDVFQYVIFDRGQTAKADVKTLITQYPTTPGGKISLRLVEYMAGYVVENNQARWSPIGEATTTEVSDGDLAWFEVGLQLMESHLKKK